LALVVAPKPYQAGRAIAQTIELYLSVPGAATPIRAKGIVAPLAAQH
jgi:hypothetical protein